MKKNWLEKVLEESRALTAKDLDSYEPKRKVLPDENVAGFVSEDLKKIFFLAKNYGKHAGVLFEEIKALIIKAVTEQKVEEHEAIKKKISEFRAQDEQTQAISKIFWDCLHDEFSLWDKPMVGIREGWQVVWSNHEINVPEIIFGFGQMPDPESCTGFPEPGSSRFDN